MESQIQLNTCARILTPGPCHRPSLIVLRIAQDRMRLAQSGLIYDF